MNENILSFIKWAAGIVITLAIISIVVVIFQTSRGAVSDGIGKIADLNTAMSEADLTQFDGEVVSGSEVVYLIKNKQKEYLGIQVTTGTGVSTWYGYTCTLGSPASIGAESGNTFTMAIEETSSAYIHKSGKFKGSIYRDSNDRIVAVTFVQQ